MCVCGSEGSYNCYCRSAQVNGYDLSISPVGSVFSPRTRAHRLLYGVREKKKSSSSLLRDRVWAGRPGEPTDFYRIRVCASYPECVRLRVTFEGPKYLLYSNDDDTFDSWSRTRSRTTLVSRNSRKNVKKKNRAHLFDGIDKKKAQTKPLFRAGGKDVT